MNHTALTAHADQLAARLRDARCCDAFAPCASCRVGRETVQVARRLAEVPAAPEVEVPAQRRPSRLGRIARRS